MVWETQLGAIIISRMASIRGMAPSESPTETPSLDDRVDC
jgi:hypothetical protein